MKKEAVFFVVMILLANFVFAAADSDTADVTPEGFQEENSLLNNFSDVGSDVKNFSGVKGKSNEVLAKEIEIPENLQFASKILFGLKSEGQVNLQQFIIMIGVFIFLLLLIKSILELVPFFGGGWKSWAGSILVTALVSVAGGTLLAVDFILSLSTLFGVLDDWGVVNLAIALALLVGFFFLLSKILKIVKRKTNLEKAKSIGDDVAYLSAAGQAAKEGMKMASEKG